MNKISFILSCAIFAFASSAFADTNITTDSRSGAISGSESQGGSVNFHPTTNSVVKPPIYPTNPSPSVVPNPNLFVPNAPGLAEKTAGYSELFAKIFNDPVAANALLSERAETIIDDNDDAGAEFRLVKSNDYLKTNIPSEDNAVRVNMFSPVVYDVGSTFGAMNPSVHHYMLGYVAIKTTKDLVLQEELLAEANRFAAKHLTGFETIIPVYIYDTTAIYDGNNVNGRGYSVTPQVSGVAGALMGSIFSLQGNDGNVIAQKGTAIKVYYLAVAPNPTEGHALAAAIRRINDAFAASQIPPPKEIVKEVVVQKVYVGTKPAPKKRAVRRKKNC